MFVHLMNEHINYIHRCFELAEKGRGYTKSNPLVGAVFVHGDKIVSEGYHCEYGGAHAEVKCLDRIHDDDILKNGTLYVSLEPCCHHGKTPPCTDLIIQKGIRRVVIGSLDFNQTVHGKGMEILKEYGIEVINLDMIVHQRLLNSSFYINQTKKRPFFKAKFAYSQDGLMGKKEGRVKITTLEMDFWSHKMRYDSDAVLVGSKTWIADQPKLDARLYRAYYPDIIILTHQPDLVVSSRSQQKIVVLNPDRDESKENVFWVRTEINDGKAVAVKLFELGYRNVLIEGGRETIQFFQKLDLIDELVTIQNESIKLNNGVHIPEIEYNRFVLSHTYTIDQETKKQYIHHDFFTI